MSSRFSVYRNKKHLEARRELEAEKIIKKHKIFTLHNASNQVLDFQAKLTKAMSEESISGSQREPVDLEMDIGSRLLARDDQANTKCTKPPQFDPVPSEDEGRSLQSDEDPLELSGDATEREGSMEAKRGESEPGVEDQDETIRNESKEEEEVDDINLREFTIPNEPGFILKLHEVMDTFKKSTNPVDKTLAQLGILRLSSRPKIYEPSTMRAEAMRALSEQEKAELKTFTDVPAVMGVPVFEGSTLKDHWQNLSSFTPSTTVERTTLRLHELFLTGLEGNEELTKAMNERTFTAKYIVPLNNWPFQDQQSIMSFWCEKGNEELVRSKDIEHNLWDGAFLDTDFESKPHIILHEVSGGTEGCSASKLKSDLLKLAKGMKKHLQRLGGSVNGTNINDARRVRVGGVQYVGNYAFSQTMCALAPDIYVMWEWAANILPRSMEQMVHLDKTIRSVYAMKEIWLETKRLIGKAQREASLASTEDFLSGCSSPIRPDDGPWKELFHSLQ